LGTFRRSTFRRSACCCSLCGGALPCDTRGRWESCGGSDADGNRRTRATSLLGIGSPDFRSTLSMAGIFGARVSCNAARSSPHFSRSPVRLQFTFLFLERLTNANCGAALLSLAARRTTRATPRIFANECAASPSDAPRLRNRLPRSNATGGPHKCHDFSDGYGRSVKVARLVDKQDFGNHRRGTLPAPQYHATRRSSLRYAFFPINKPGLKLQKVGPVGLRVLGVAADRALLRGKASRQNRIKFLRVGFPAIASCAFAGPLPFVGLSPRVRRACPTSARAPRLFSLVDFPFCAASGHRLFYDEVNAADKLSACREFQLELKDTCKSYLRFAGG